MRDILTPIQSRLEQSFSRFQESISALSELGTLRQDNARLKRENDELMELALGYRAAQEEISRLREILDYKSDTNLFRSVTARIIGWPSTWSSRFMLNVGSKEGVMLDLPVRTPRGLVGRIVSVASGSCELMVLSDLLSGVGGRLVSNGSLGVVRGQGSQNPHLKMINISLDADVRPGDSVVTSGLGDSFPEGILIGTVVSVENDATSQHQTATLQMAVDTYRLHEVQILIADNESWQVEDELDLLGDP